MKKRLSHPAFSLLEVVVAIALFGATVSILLGWLPGLTRHPERGIDRIAAQGLPDALKLELDRLGADDLDALAARLPILNQAMPAGGLPFAAPRHGLPVSALDESTSPRDARDEVFFLLECWRFEAEPLRYAPEKRFLAVAVRTRWPAVAVTASPAGKFEELWFVVALNR